MSNNKIAGCSICSSEIKKLPPKPSASSSITYRQEKTSVFQFSESFLQCVLLSFRFAQFFGSDLERRPCGAERSLVRGAGLFFLIVIVSLVYTIAAPVVVVVVVVVVVALLVAWLAKHGLRSHTAALPSHAFTHRLRKRANCWNKHMLMLVVGNVKGASVGAVPSLRPPFPTQICLRSRPPITEWSPNTFLPPPTPS